METRKRPKTNPSLHHTMGKRALEKKEGIKEIGEYPDWKRGVGSRIETDQHLGDTRQG